MPGPKIYKKGDRQNLNEKVSKQHASVAFASAPVSRFLLCLGSCLDFLQ